jgi:F5/8 type C domain
MKLLLVLLQLFFREFNRVKMFFLQKGFSPLSRMSISLFLVVLLSFMTTTNIWAARHKTDWLYDARWGVMTHYLTTPDMSAKDWNERVNSFDVNGLAKQLKLIGAKYYMISLGQNSGHYCTPNSKYDYYTKIVPSKCSSRDLVADLYGALNPLGIKLMVYLPANAPAQDGVAHSRLDWKDGPYRKKLFQVKWESIIREWSLRWGRKVSGWWFDGVYWSKEMYDHNEAPNFKSFAAAAKAGNPESIIAFNPGVIYPVISLSDHEDYTAGEIEQPLGMECESRWIKKAQFHVLSYLGTNWSTGSTRYTDKQVIDATNNINKCQGTISWDVPIQTNGKIPKPFMDQLLKLRSGLKSRQKLAMILETPAGNLASNKKAKFLDITGRKELAVNSGKYFPIFGVDGDPKTFALAGNEWPWIYQVDLGKVYPISRINVTFGPTFATEFEVVYSTNKLNWSVLKKEEGSQGGTYNYKLASTAIRYIRVKGIKPNAPNQPGTMMSIAEVEAYK